MSVLSRTVFPVFALFFSLTAAAQTELVMDVTEDYSGRVPVSGGVIAGAAFGKLTGKADPRSLSFVLSKNAGSSTVCFDAMTRDGQYAAHAKVKALPDDQQTISIVPAKGWAYLSQLKKYSRGDYAPMIKIGENCQIDADPVILPVNVGGAHHNVLTVFINSQRALRASAKLLVEGAAPIVGTCTRFSSVERRSTAFDYACQFDLAGSSQTGLTSLVVDRMTGVGPRSNTARIFLPAPASGG